MTSNIWQEEFSEKANKIWFEVSESTEDEIMADYTKAKENIISNLTDYFSPEFINRIDKIVVFNPLDKEKIKSIVELLLKDFEQRLSEKDLKLNYTPKVVEEIAKKVYNPEFWAREVRRFIQDNIEDNIAELIINWTEKKEFTIKLKKDLKNKWEFELEIV